MTEKQLERKLTAFYVFATDGLERVKSKFPDELEFIEANSERNYDEVKEELIATFEKKINAV